MGESYCRLESRCKQAQTEALKGTGGTIHKSGVVFICSPGPTVVGLLSSALSQKFRALVRVGTSSTTSS